jgi:hypothetical protein
MTDFMFVRPLTVGYLLLMTTREEHKILIYFVLPITYIFQTSNETMSCIEESSLTQEVTTFGAAALLDLGWNAFVAALYFCCLKARLDGAPALGAQFFAISGFLQLLATAALFVFCVPHCASCCPFHTQQWHYCRVHGTDRAWRKCWRVGNLGQDLIVEFLAKFHWMPPTVTLKWR